MVDVHEVTRAAEFCYIAERADGEMLLALKPLDPGMPALWTRDPEEAVRHTFDGIRMLQKRLGATVGFRKILVG